MLKFVVRQAGEVIFAIMLALSICQSARAADLSGGLPPGGPQEVVPPAVFGFNPLFDPRCRIVPIPEANLVGDTARLRPTAVCQSRGMYVDTVVVP